MQMLGLSSTLLDSHRLPIGRHSSKQRLQRPNLARDPGSHRGRYPQRLVDAAEIIVREVQSASRLQVPQLLRENGESGLKPNPKPKSPASRVVTRK
jgi:hypothetical protein